MRSSLIGSHVPAETRNGRAAHARPWSAAAGRWLAGAGTVLAVLTAAACSSAGGNGGAAASLSLLRPPPGRPPPWSSSTSRS